MNINIGADNTTVLDIKNIRAFQHLALLVDRDDFKEDIKKIRPIVLSSLFSKPKSAIEQYIPAIPKEITDILEKYRYPQSLENAILSLLIKNTISDEDIRNYDPPIGQPKSKLRDYIFHPIDIRLDKKIKQHREWYLTYKQNNAKEENIYLGYREVAKNFDKSYTTIATAISSYQQKLNIPIS